MTNKKKGFGTYVFLILCQNKFWYTEIFLEKPVKMQNGSKYHCFEIHVQKIRGIPSLEQCPIKKETDHVKIRVPQIRSLRNFDLISIRHIIIPR